MEYKGEGDDLDEHRFEEQGRNGQYNRNQGEAVHLVEPCARLRAKPLLGQGFTHPKGVGYVVQVHQKGEHENNGSICPGIPKNKVYYKTLDTILQQNKKTT